ncbi:hypothetical protein GUITHDRAFT_143960 [Guillardia theta CCMP2712]|uniref:Uncharacterized protein n=1 Tax=Guillardia theta (strain CCMP2712) TaxID=905079 RepID=L1ISH6_GUITC|nr:hypothetical protein GUITHDRAFT_143960 [Guillardia theta CCMP2712]EKX38765.1 hypothetical protein GUITHDRAFT_143960 [Guillardia theta CCMP2712]|eukprot:XP_005825745.1 hypothetical protein GUITHDRAFT_143960 [Guillardia theta CCMP2712]
MLLLLLFLHLPLLLLHLPFSIWRLFSVYMSWATSHVPSLGSSCVSDMPARTHQPVSRAAADDREEEGYILTANWGNIFITLSLLPIAMFAILNPISVFFLVFWSITATFVSFAPKFCYFLLLEWAILRGRGSKFFDANHTKRIRGVFPSLSMDLAWLEAFTTEMTNRIGGGDIVASAALKEVALARKKYSERVLTWEEMLERLLRFPWFLFQRFREHVESCFNIASHTVLKFIALRIIVKLYSKHPVSQRGR